MSRLKDGNLQNFEITITIYSNSERSAQFLKQNAFLFNLFLEIFQNITLEQLTIRIQIGKNNCDLKLENEFSREGRRPEILD